MAELVGPRPPGFAVFVVLALAAHLGLFALWPRPQAGGPNGAGAGGDGLVTLAPSAAALADLVAEWERPPVAPSLALPPPMNRPIAPPLAPEAPAVPAAPEALSAPERAAAPDIALPAAAELAPPLPSAPPKPKPAVTAPKVTPKAPPKTPVRVAKPKPQPSLAPPPEAAAKQAPPEAAAKQAPPEAAARQAPPEAAARQAPPEAAARRAAPEAAAKQAAPAVAGAQAAGAGGGGAAGLKGRAAEGSFSPAQVETALGRWQSQIKTRIARAIRKPRLSEGAFVLRLQIEVARSGALRSVRVTQSTGLAELDAIGVAAVQRAAPFPAAPRALAEPAYAMAVPIRFTP